MIRVIFLVILFVFNLANASSRSSSIVNSEIFKLSSYDIAYGNEDAAIQVLEYYSLTCPHCSNFYENIFPGIKKDYIDTGKVKWIKRGFITDSHAFSGSMLMACVERDDRERYLNILLTKQSNWAYQKDSIEILRNIAALGGMSSKDFSKCMTNKENESAIKDISIKAQNNLNISATPVFFINQKKISIYSNKSFRDYLDKLLVEIKK